MNSEPVRLIAALRALAAALITALTAFGLWTPSAAQVAALAGIWIPLELLAAEVLRSKVTSQAHLPRSHPQ